jgi:hypothetical protein
MVVDEPGRTGGQINDSRLEGSRGPSLRRESLSGAEFVADN